MTTAINNSFSRTIDSGDIDSYVPQQGSDFKYDALSVISDESTSAVFTCEKHEMAMNMAGARRSFNLNEHTIKLPESMPDGRLIVSYEANDDGMFVTAKLHTKESDGHTHVRKFDAITLTYEGVSEIELTETSNTAKAELDGYGLDAKEYVTYKALKSDGSQEGQSPKRPLPIVGTSVLSTPEQTGTADQAQTQPALNGSYKRTASALMDKVFDKSITDKSDVFKQIDRLKTKAFDELSKQASISMGDVEDYCDMVNILHKKANKLSEANAKIDELYPLNDPSSAALNKQLKTAIALKSLGEKDNAASVMNFPGSEEEFIEKNQDNPDALADADRTVYREALNDRSAELLRGLSNLDESDRESFARVLEGNGDVGKLADFTNVVASVDAPRFYRKGEYWEGGGRLIPRSENNDRAGQPKPVQSLVEIISEAKWIKPGVEGDSDAQLLHSTLVKFAKAKNLTADQWAADIDKISDAELAGNPKDAKRKTIDKLTADELKSYLMSVVADAVQAQV